MRKVGQVELEVLERSIVTLDVESIVNAANATLGGGGGVDGAIQRAAGPELKAAGLALPQVRPGVRCEPGDAKVTPGFRLKARFVIHTVGPVWRGGEQGEPEVLARCYRSAFAEVERLGVKSVAFPAISTGAFGYPVVLATQIAIRETLVFAQRQARPIRVVFALIEPQHVRMYLRELNDVLGVG